ncbi:MAG: hypothetical protein ACYSWQ_14720 [Planctomycetota bacterium]|jgi:hypothetical protein
MTRITAVFLVVLFAVAASSVYPAHVATKSNSLEVAVEGFNAEARTHPVGKSQLPLTEAEVIAAIRGWIPKTTPGVTDDVYNRFQDIAESRVLPEGAHLSHCSAWTGYRGFHFTVWWIDLNIKTSETAGYTFRIRDQKISSRKLTSDGLDANSKPVAVEFLKVLPSADSFEFSNAAVMFSDKHLKPHAIPSKGDWQRSDMAEVLGRVGAKLEDVLQARSGVEVSTRKLKSNAVILQLPKRIIQKLKNDIVRSNFDIRKVGDIEIFTPGVELGKSLGKVSYALIADKLITGDADTVDEIVKAFSGAYKGSTIYYRESIRSVWEELPDGFSITVAIGNKHSYISGLPAISYGKSTRKINKELAEEVFIANFPTPEEADSARKKIEENIHGFATVTGRDMSVKEVKLINNMVIIRTRVALKDVTF